MKNTLREHLEKNLPISTPSSDKVPFRYRLKLLTNYLLIVPRLCLVLLVWFSRVVRRILPHSLEARIVFNLICLVFLSWFEGFEGIEVDFISVIILLLTYNFNIYTFLLLTLLHRQGLLECPNINCTTLEQIHQLSDFCYHAQIVALHSLLLALLDQLRLLILVGVVLIST